MAKAQESGRKHEWTPDELMAQVQKILEIKDRVMREGIHFGVIPGCKKPSLWKPGAEKLCQAFRLVPRFETLGRDDAQRTVKWNKKGYSGKEETEGSTTGYLEYESRCSLVHIPSGEEWARNVGGSCSNFEAKYRSLNPYDVKNTVEKMAEKRAFVSAVLIATGASDIFGQDLEDLAYLHENGNGGGSGNGSMNGNSTGSGDAQAEPGGDKEPGQEGSPHGQSPAKGNGSAKGNGGNGGGSSQPSGNGNNLRMATPKQVKFMQDQLKKQEIPDEEFFEEWAEDFKTWDGIPFHLVNDVLAWIRE